MQISTVSTGPMKIAARTDSEKTATRIDPDGLTLKQDLSLTHDRIDFSFPSLEDYQNQLRTQGAQEQAILVTKQGSIVASVARDGSAMFQDPAVAKIWDTAGGDTEAFVSALRKSGYGSTIYKQGTGPTYAEVHQKIHGESYTALISRQAMEFVREEALASGKTSFFSTVG